MNPRTRQRGNALVETALIMPVLIGIAVFSADLYNVSQARAHMERSAHTLAATLSMQNRLDRDSLEALIAHAAPPEVLGAYELVITKVNHDRSMDWKPLLRGDEQDLCPAYSSGRKYSGELPETTTSESEDDDQAIRSSMLVVQLCRRSDDLALSSNLLPEKDLQALAFSRMVYNNVTVDEQLAEELGVDVEEKDE